jgi:hypothetical protein
MPSLSIFLPPIFLPTLVFDEHPKIFPHQDFSIFVHPQSLGKPNRRKNSRLKTADPVKPMRTGGPRNVRLNDGAGALHSVGCVAPQIRGQLGNALNPVKLVQVGGEGHRRIVGAQGERSNPQ